MASALSRGYRAAAASIVLALCILDLTAPLSHSVVPRPCLQSKGVRWGTRGMGRDGSSCPGLRVLRGATVISISRKLQLRLTSSHGVTVSE